MIISMQPKIELSIELNITYIIELGTFFQIHYP